VSHSTDHHDKDLYQYLKATTYSCWQKWRIRQTGSRHVPNIEKLWCVVAEKTVIIGKIILKTPYFYWYLLLLSYKNRVDFGKRERIFDTLHVFSIVMIVVWYWLKWLGQTNVWRSRKQFIRTALWIKKLSSVFKLTTFH
jgi:hypothetical protein